MVCNEECKSKARVGSPRQPRRVTMLILACYYYLISVNEVGACRDC